MTTASTAAGSFRQALLTLGGFSAAINILLLAQSIYSIQVYDRVLASRSVETLLYLTAVTGLALLVTAALEIVRAVIANRAAARFEVSLSQAALRTAIRKGSAAGSGSQPLRDIATLRALMSSKGLFALLDLPFGMLFVGLMYLVHPDLFWITLLGAALLALVAGLNQWALAHASRRQGEFAVAAQARADHMLRGADSVVAMGMAGHVVDDWGKVQAEHLTAADRAASLNAWFAGLSKLLRLSLQTAVLGYGALLVLQNEMTAGMMFASSLISGRALQPIDQLIGSWRQLAGGQQAWARVRAFLDMAEPERRHTSLPRPSGRVEVQDLYQPDFTSPNTRPPVLARVSFRLAPGQIVAVVGPSGAGKSTLARMLVGAAQPRGGLVRIDGHDIANWNPEALGRCIGYVAQEVELLPGTVAQNIARFDPAARDEDVIAAARAAHAEDLIRKLPMGYDTPVGPGELRLSGGERQRIALARALYGNPRLIVLDEPNANLDRTGEAALTRALAEARKSGAAILVITQREALLSCADKIMRIQNGTIVEFDDREALMARHGASATARPAPRVLQAAGRP